MGSMMSRKAPQTRRAPRQKRTFCHLAQQLMSGSSSHPGGQVCLPRASCGRGTAACTWHVHVACSVQRPLCVCCNEHAGAVCWQRAHPVCWFSHVIQAGAREHKIC